MSDAIDILIVSGITTLMLSAPLAVALKGRFMLKLVRAKFCWMLTVQIGR